VSPLLEGVIRGGSPRHLHPNDATGYYYDDDHQYAAYWRAIKKLRKAQHVKALQSVIAMFDRRWTWNENVVSLMSSVKYLPCNLLQCVIIVIIITIIAIDVPC